MSDARTDFFASSARPSKPPPTREDFFAGKMPDDSDSFDPASESLTPEQVAKLTPAQRKQREQKILGDFAKGTQNVDFSPLEELPNSFNRGVADVLGLPGNLAADVTDIGGAAYGTVASLITGKPAGEHYEPMNRAETPLTGDWIAKWFDRTPLGPVTQPVKPDDPGHQFVYNVGRNIPSALIGGKGSFAPTMASATAGTVAAQMGADPATQVAASLLAGHVTSKFMAPVEPSTAREVQEETAQQKLDRAASSQSMGAAGAAVDLQRLSPDLRDAVEKAVQKTGGAVNPEAMARHIQADSLPVKVHLSEGQVLADPRLISEERNARGATPGFVEGFAAQNKALTENLRVFRDTAGENVFSTNPVEHGDTLIERYKAIDEARNADIGAKYEALRDAAGGAFPVDTPQLLQNVRAALKKDLATSKAPADVMGLLEEKAASGGMTLEDFESARTTLARIQRSAADGQERHAAGVIRNQLEAMPLQEGAGQLKGLADTARAAARERFQAMEADPAYKAAVNETVAPDKFVQKFVIGGTRDNVAKLSQAMSSDATAAQTLKVATIDHLRQAAGIDASFNGNFTQAGYNKALRALEPKLGSLLDPQLMEHVQNLGDVARYSQQQPEGHYVNNSNTSVAQRALAHGADVLEGAANVKAGGVPVGTWIRQNVTDRAGRKAAARTFAPGAGLTRLSDLAKLKEQK